AVKQIIDTTPLNWNDVYAAAFGQKAAPGAGYEDNFRAGRIARRKAALIYGWLCQEYPEAAATLDAALNPGHSQPDTVPRWEDFLLQRGTYGQLDTVPIDKVRIGIVTFADTEPVSDRTIKRGQPF